MLCSLARRYRRSFRGGSSAPLPFQTERFLLPSEICTGRLAAERTSSASSQTRARVPSE